MSRAFSSEEYEVEEMIVDNGGPETHEGDSGLVFDYCAGRDLSDPSLPYEIGMNFLEGCNGFFRSDEFAVKWLRKAAEAGKRESYLPLARLLMKDVKTNGYKEAAALFKKASDNDEIVPELFMSNISDPSKRSAYDAYRLNAENGDPEACFLLAQGFDRGLYGKDKAKAAAKWYRIALKNGDLRAKERLLALHDSGRVQLSEKEMKELIP